MQLTYTGGKMATLQGIWESIQGFFQDIGDGISAVTEMENGGGLLYTAAARWIFIILALFILVKSIASLLLSRNPSEVWAYFNVDGIVSHPITHWENVIGRSKSCDIVINDGSVSRNHGILIRDAGGNWLYSDLGSSNGSLVNGERIRRKKSVVVNPGDEISIGESICTIFPISLEEKRNNTQIRKRETILLSPWTSLIAITIFQLMTVGQLKIALGDSYVSGITVGFLGLCAVMWVYVFAMRALRRKGFEMETIAFFLSTLSLAVTASVYPGSVLKQFIAAVLGVALFVAMCTVLRNIQTAKKLRIYMYAGAAFLLAVNLIFGISKFGAANWIMIGGVSFQPSEIVKLAFIWVGAASLDELFEKKNSLIFMVFAGFCFCCLAIMGDFGTAIIFFVTFLVISFLRTGDFTKLIVIVGVAFVGGLLVLKFKSYVAERFAAWGHVWEFAETTGYQQTRTMSAAASGGLVGVGAGEGWLKGIPAASTDLVFGFLTEEWGLIIAIMAVISIVTLSLFAIKSIWAGRSTFYTIGACSAMSMFLFQTILNVFGSVDLFPLTGVTFPFVSNGGTSMISSWGMLAFLKAADTRQNASIAVSLKDRAKGGISQ